MSVNQKLYYIFHYFVNPVRITSTHGLSYLSVYKFNNIIFNASETSRTDKNSKNLVYPQRSACYLQKFMHDFKSKGLCLFVPCFESCLKKMRNLKMNEKTQIQF